MAIQVNYVDDEKGMTITSAYIKITNFGGDKDNISFSVEVFSNEQARVDDKDPISNTMYFIPYGTGAVLITMYDHLKTLPEFSGAVDV